MDNRNLPYRDDFQPTHSVAEFLRQFDELNQTRSTVSVAGRVMGKRVMGKIAFLHIASAGERLQVMAKRDESPAAFDAIKTQFRLGDIIGVTGEAITTKTGERTLYAANVALLSPTATPMPDKWNGVADQETRYRHRHLDLIMNQQSLETFRRRFAFTNHLRKTLSEQGYVEVETPTLQETPGGASARPFVTHHNALDVDLYLRIAPETYLKRLIVGGFEKVFEVAKCFRNEGVDPSHLQEFTMLEFYKAYATYHDTMPLTRDLIRGAVQAATGSCVVEIDGQVYDLRDEWPVVDYREAVLRDSGIDVLETTADKLAAAIRAKGHDVDLGGNPSVGTLVDRLYKRLTRPKLQRPCFLVRHPISLLPLARPNDAQPLLADSFQILFGGWEIAKGYSELADPFIQRRFLEEQSRNRASGDEEAMHFDEAFVQALETGLPPTSGVGIGLDRLIAMVTKQTNLRDVILFPTMR